MDFRRMESEFGSRRFQAAARKLLAGKAEPTPAALAPSPGSTTAYMCRDVKSGATVSCQNPHTLVIIVAGMSCMMFLVSIAMVLLCWSVGRQRRIERQRRESGAADQTSSSSGGVAPAPAVAPVDSPEFDDAVLVQLPGDEKPQFFALPKPFLADEHHGPQDAKTPAEVAITSGEKEPGSENPLSENPSSEDVPANPVVEDACVPSSGGLFHNPLFAPR